MPGTINGIGTTYRGKKDLTRRTGVCQKCHRQTDLESYETRLYWVFLFLPVIPLERKQIVDYCPICTAHLAIPLHQWKAMTQEAIEKAGREAAGKPDDAYAALELHGTLVSFHRDEEAARVADTLARNFPDNLDVQLHLGSWHAQSGRDRQADAHFDKALALDPHNPAARRAVGIACLERGDLARARELLAFMEKKCPEQDPHVLILLADAFGDRGDHQQAMDLYEVVIWASPRLGQDRRLRKRIAKSEAALGRGESILPKLPLYRRPAFRLAALAAVAVAGVLLYNHFLGTKPLHIVNGLPVPVDVTFDDGDGPYTVPAGSRQTVRLGLGGHQAVVARQDGDEQTVEFDMECGLFKRLSGKTLFIFNVAGAADFLWQKAIYTKAPARNPAADQYRIHFGKDFLAFDDVDYSFEEDFPKQIETESHAARLAKIRVSTLDAPPAAVITMFPEGTPPNELMDFAEHHLGLDPGDEPLLFMYTSVVYLAGGSTDRMREFLGTRLDRRPVAIEWHRAYQDACRATGRDDALAAAYHKMLQGSPEDSALLYLRGRATRECREADGYYERSMQADPGNPYPRMAKGYRLALLGDYAAARPLAAEAHRLKPGAASVAELFAEVRLALGEYAELETELREARQKNPLELNTQRQLMVVLAAAGKLDAAAECQLEFERTVAGVLARAGGQDPLQRVVHSRLALAYLRDRMDEHRQIIQELKDPAVRQNAGFVADLEEGRPAAAAQALEKMQPGPVRFYHALLVSLCWSRKGNTAEAGKWRQAAIEELQHGSLENRCMAELLAKEDDVNLEQLDDVTASRPVKLLLLVVLADRSKTQRAALLERAEKLNLPGLFPYRFLKQTIAAMKE